MTFIIGITGGTGAGKSSALKALQAIGAKTLDCDAIYHELLADNAEMSAEIEAGFDNIITDGKIDRRKLGDLVWRDPALLRKLNTITHKYMDIEIDRRINALVSSGMEIIAIDAIALIESGQNKKCDAVVGIIAPLEKRLSRVMTRDNLTREQALLRINAQQPESFYRKNCDFVLENPYDTQETFNAKCESFFKELRDGMMANRTDIRTKIDAWFDKNADDMINDLGKLIEINSVRSKAEEGAPYGADSRAVLALAQTMLEERGFDVNVFEDMMITAVFGPAPPLIGILAHLDIVAVGEGWDTDPLKATIKDGKIYGRGVLDNKGPSVAAMYALYCARDLFPQLDNGVQLILGSGEETGFDDVTQYLKKNSPPPNVFTPDAEYPVVNIEKGRFMPVFGAKWEKDLSLPRIVSISGGKTPNVVPNYAEAVIQGFSTEEIETSCREFSDKTGVKLTAKTAVDSLLITAEGTAAHASLPERGNNAQTALIEMLAALPFAKSKGFEYICKLNRLFPHGDYRGTALGIDMEDEKTGRITVNFGVLRFSEYEFSGNFDSRTPACADTVDLLGKTKASLNREGVDITYHEITGCHHTPEETVFVQKLLNIYEEYTGQPGKCTSMGGLTYVHDIPGGVAFGCAMPGDDNKVHGANEFIDKNQFITSAKMFTQAIIDMCATAGQDRNE